MAVQRFRLDLSQASFPLLSDKAARTVIVPNLDQQARQQQNTRESPRDPYTRPQVLFMENFMPVREGYRSTRNSKVVNAADAFANLDNIHVLVDNTSRPALFCTGSGQQFVKLESGDWIEYPFGGGGPFGIPAPEANSPNTAATATVTTAVVEGASYVCYSRLTSGAARAYTFTGTYDPTATALTVQVVSGLYNTTFTLGTSAELTVSGTAWTLAIPSLALPYGALSLTATQTVGGNPVAATQTHVAGTDMSLLQLHPTYNTLVSATNVTNIPFDPGHIDGISSSNGYLLLWSDLSIAWAPYNTDTNGFDWTLYRNGNFTGAGYQIPEAVASAITAVVSVAGGFIMFTATNAVAATYHAGNINAPWVFREVPGAGGVPSTTAVTVDTSLGHVYAYTTAGFQRITLNGVTEVFFDVADLIQGGVYETYNSSTKTLELQQHELSRTLAYKLVCAGNRYLCVLLGQDSGVGNSTFEFILVYDLALERWGRLKTVEGARSVVFYPELGYYSGAAGIDGGTAISVMTWDGSIYRYSWKPIDGPSLAGTMILGRLQLSRGKHIQLSRIEVERTTGLGNTLAVQPSYTGVLLASTISMTTSSAGGMSYVNCLIDCTNFNLIVSGHFNLTSIQLEATTSGAI